MEYHTHTFNTDHNYKSKIDVTTIHMFATVFLRIKLDSAYRAFGCCCSVSVTQSPDSLF